jgi:DNA polymerase (family 10)
MKNLEVAKMLYFIAIYLEMDEVQFKPRAYEKAANSIESLEKDVMEIYKEGGIEALMEIPGVGEAIAKKIEEFILTGKIAELERLKKKVPVDVEGLMGIEGIGPKRIKTLYKKLGIKKIEDLEKAAKNGKIRKLEGFGEKSEQNILRGIDFLKKSKGRLLLGYVLPVAREIEERLRNLKEVQHVSIAGSLRRRKETIGDIDILVTSSNPSKVMNFFVKMPEVAAVYGKGSTKSTVRLKIGCDADLRVVEDKSFGAALQYFTGNVDHNVGLRKIAISKGYKLNEYGIFKGNKQIAGKTEEEVYKALGVRWIPPELREHTGEIEIAKKNKLPKLIEYDSLKGDLHIQTKWTDGANSIKDMAEAAKKLGLEYIAITDHTKRNAFVGGLDEKQILKQKNEIDKVNKGIAGLTILSGTEVDILKNGKLDISNKVLSQLEVVGASVHSNFNLSKEEQTNRIIKAMENENVDILFHPTGRLIQQREPYDVDIERIIQTAKNTGTILEINSFPSRLDLKDEHIKLAVKDRIKLVIDSDAHSTLHFKFLEFGIAQARRGWAEKKDVVNTRPLKEFLKSLK